MLLDHTASRRAGPGGRICSALAQFKRHRAIGFLDVSCWRSSSGALLEELFPRPQSARPRRRSKPDENVRINGVHAGLRMEARRRRGCHAPKQGAEPFRIRELFSFRQVELAACAPRSAMIERPFDDGAGPIPSRWDSCRTEICPCEVTRECAMAIPKEYFDYRSNESQRTRPREGEFAGGAPIVSSRAPAHPSSSAECPASSVTRWLVAERRRARARCSARSGGCRFAGTVR